MLLYRQILLPVLLLKFTGKINANVTLRFSFYSTIFSLKFTTKFRRGSSPNVTVPVNLAIRFII